MARFAPVYMNAYDGYTFSDLELDNETFADNDAEDTVIGELTGQFDSSTLSVEVGSGNVKLDGNNLVVGGTPTVAGDLDVTIRESNPNGEGLYHDTEFTITVTAA